MLYNFGTYFPTYGYYPPNLNQDYTPIAIDFKGGLTDGDDLELFAQADGEYKPRYRLRISLPRSSRKGIAQHIADSVIVPIASDGVFRYKLAPSTSYYPFGRYIVEYYKHRNSIPLDIQEWTVPAISKTLKYVINYEEGVEEYSLPVNAWNVLSASPAAEYVSNYNKIRFVSTIDFVNNQPVTLTYQPAVTLDQLIDYEANQQHYVSHIRY